MLLVISEGYLPVVQTGLQTLCIIAAGRIAASRGLFDPAPVCRTLNRFVVVACLPALQFWLLAIKTDMRNMEHWRAVSAFMLWTLLVQIGCTVWALVFDDGKLSRICVHSLVLAANNTGILAPIVLEAVVGPSAAAVGMLATIVLYFQQLPVAMVLFELDRMAKRALSGTDSAPVCEELVLPRQAPEVKNTDEWNFPGNGAAGQSCGMYGIPRGAGSAWKGMSGSRWQDRNVGEICSTRSPGSGGARDRAGVCKQEVMGEVMEVWGGASGPKFQLETAASSTCTAAAVDGLAGPLISANESYKAAAVRDKMLSCHCRCEMQSGSSRALPSRAQSVSHKAWITGSAAAAAQSPEATLTPNSSAGSSGGGDGSVTGESGGGRGGGAGRLAAHRWSERTVSCFAASEGAAIEALAGADVGLKAAAAPARVGGGRADGVEVSPGQSARCTNDSGCVQAGGYRTDTAAASPALMNALANHYGLLVTADRPIFYPHPRDLAPCYPHPLISHQDVPRHHASEALHQRSHPLQQNLTAMPASDAVQDSCSSYGSDGARAETSSAAALGNAGARASADEPSIHHAVQLVLGNTLMWTTGAAAAVSMLGLHTVLDPDIPSHIRELGFVEGTLSWLARCSVPVSLFAMGLFTAARPGCKFADSRSALTVVAYLAVKLLLLPWLMVFVNTLMGLDGRLAKSMVVLTCVPVGQNAFLLTEQFGEGAEAVTTVMQAGLILMLPHVAVVMAVLNWMGLYQGPT